CSTQAEDGIRVRTVTGVQTCALPISELHPALVNAEARELIMLAQEYGAIGWKGNGAGGEGGSITLLCGSSASAQRSLLRSAVQRSEERRVGEECRWRKPPDD